MEKISDSGFFNVNVNGDKNGVEYSLFDYFKPYFKSTKDIEILENER